MTTQALEPGDVVRVINPNSRWHEQDVVVWDVDDYCVNVLPTIMEGLVRLPIGDVEKV